MGQFFERILLQDKGISGLMTMMSGITKAAAAIGYQPCEDGLGIPISFTQYPDSEWFEFSSPLLAPGAETAKLLLKSLAKEGRVPMLSLTCVDSDFVLCRLIDEKSGTDTTACINEPYEDLGFGEPDYAAWTVACKKKWKCKPEQFKAVFENRYTFAEDGLESLADLLHFSPAVLPDGDERQADRTFWFLPNQELNETTRLHTLSEKLADYMEQEYAEKLETLGYSHFKNSPLRWHKVVGAPGNEVLLSMVLCVRYEECEPFYGAQSLFCPLELTDRYMPLHIRDGYWREARSEYPRKFGTDPLVIPNNPEAGGWDTVLSFNDPKQLLPFIDDLILPELEEIRDLPACRTYYLNSFAGRRPFPPDPINTYAHEAFRLWIEAALDGDEESTRRWYELYKKDVDWWMERGIPFQDRDVWLPSLHAYETGGTDALLQYLRDTVYRDNLRKLKRAGIIV